MATYNYANQAVDNVASLANQLSLSQAGVAVQDCLCAIHMSIALILLQ